jgi:hypothetical protein
MTAFPKQFLSQKFVELSAESHMQMKPSTRCQQKSDFFGFGLWSRSGSNEKKKAPLF